MQKLVWLDDEDKAALNALIEVCALPGNNVVCGTRRIDFWFAMTTKYPVLRDRPIAINGIDGYIFQWESQKEVATYAKLRVDL